MISTCLECGSQWFDREGAKALDDARAEGFRAGVEAAAKQAEKDDYGIALCIRRLAPPSPEPATRRYPGSCVDSGHDFRTEEADGSRECVRCGKPAPTPGPKKCSRCGGSGLSREESHDIDCPDCTAPAPGPERCGHERFGTTEINHTLVYMVCNDCGAEWRDDGQGWRKL